MKHTRFTGNSYGQWYVIILSGTEIRSPRVSKISDSTISSQSEVKFVVMFFLSKPDSIKAKTFRKLVSFAICYNQ